MSFDEFLKMKDQAVQFRILIKRNAWRLSAFGEKPRASKQFINHTAAADGIRLAELLNPITEKI